MEFPTLDRDQKPLADPRRRRAVGVALAELALMVCLVVAIVVVLAVASASGVLAAARSDLIMMEEASNSGFTTVGIIAVIAVVMGLLTILALRDVAPVHSKRAQQRSPSGSTRR